MFKEIAEKKGFILSKENGFDELQRPCKDLYFMNLCFNISFRSIDRSSKCACVVVHKDGAILSSGYNNPIRGSNDKNIPHTRPVKYSYMEHGERNAIYNSARHGINISDSVFYITGFPCVECLRGMIQSGAIKIIYGPYVAKMCESDEFSLFEKILEKQPIIIERFKYDEGLFFLNPIAKIMVEKKKEQNIKDIDFEWNTK